jgi:hypothetical protein
MLASISSMKPESQFHRFGNPHSIQSSNEPL